MHLSWRLGLTPRHLGAVAAGLFLASALSVAPAEAAAAELSGVVRADSTGAPLADVEVEVYTIVTSPDGGMDTRTHGVATTDSAGAYSFTDLPAGAKYHLGFTRDGYVREYAHDQSSPWDAIDVAAPGTYDESLTPAAELTGKLLDERGRAVQSGWVTASPVDDTDLSTFGNGDLGPDGYRMTGLVPGRYTIEFRPDGRNGQYAYGARSSEDATEITLKVGPNTVNDKLLAQPTGVVQGTVIDKLTRRPVAGMCVDLSADVPSKEGTICVGPDGRYKFTELPTEEVTLSITDPAGRYVTDGFIRVQAVDGRTVTRDYPTIRGGELIGVAVDAVTGRPTTGTADMCVEAVRIAPTKGNSGICLDRADGRFSVRGLAAGSYQLKISAMGGGDDGPYGIGWVKADGTGTADQTSAGTFRVVMMQSTAVPKVKLYKAGTVSGVVTDRVTGKPIEHVCVGVSSYSPRVGEFSDLGDCTDAAGRYSLTKLGPFDWRVQFVPPGNYGWVWSGGSATRAGATPVAVTSGGSSALNMTLIRGAGKLTGTITLTGSTHDTIDVLNADSGEYVHDGTDGPLINHVRTYELDGITPQRVKIRFSGASGTDQWYGGTDFATAKVVTIVPGTTTVNLVGK